MNVNGFSLWTSSCAVALVLIAGFVISGSPSEQRLVRLDGLRVAHLVQLTEAFDDYWEVRDELPLKMSELLDGRRLSRMPSDPETGLAYEYEQLDPTSYQLCATFDRPSASQLAVDFWIHDAGRNCFSFTHSDVEND
tara:strand:+ start:536 stop:946 length:411 start_codon:yes stop_codon:yes gene_type:complete